MIDADGATRWDLAGAGLLERGCEARGESVMALFEAIVGALSGFQALRIFQRSREYGRMVCFTSRRVDVGMGSRVVPPREEALRDTAGLGAG